MMNSGGASMRENGEGPAEALVCLSLTAFLDRLAERSHAPGGGAAAGAVGALGAALSRMVAAYSVGKRTPEANRRIVADLAEKLGRCDAMLRGLIDEDARAYDGYRRASREDTPTATAERELALAACTAVPLEMCAACTVLLELLEALAPVAGKYMLSDLDAAAILAEAAVRAAGCNVRVNARMMRLGAPEVLENLGRIEAGAADRLARIQYVVAERLQNGH